MTKDSLQVPQARSWRDIPQPVKPRAMSGGGRWRLVFAITRVLFALTVLASVGWAGWKVSAVLAENSRKMPAAAKAVPVSKLAFTTDGVLDDAWLAHTLALRPGISLMELDLQKLRRALLASGQVETAMLTRNFPSTLMVNISERTPVARVMAEIHGEQHALFVAREGAVFEGVNFDPAMVQTLPWLDGVTLAKRGAGFAPLPGMTIVSDLLSTAKLEADHLYKTWQVISLARLASDGEIEVRMAQNIHVTFGTSEDFFRQLARLDLLLETMPKARPGQLLAQVNLSLGTQVPVSFVAPLELGTKLPHGPTNATLAPADHRGSLVLHAQPTAFSNNTAPFKIQLNREL